MGLDAVAFITFCQQRISQTGSYKRIGDTCDARPRLIIAWTIDEPKAMETIMELHPAIQICTNHPDRMMNLQK